MSIFSKMTAIADEVRNLSGVTTLLTLDDMSNNLGEANTEVNGQTDLIAQIMTALEGKAAGNPDAVELNFEIVAYSTEEGLLADTPAENTIGIITNTPINGYRFSSTEPETVNEGEVWICIGTDSSIAFDVVDDVTVYPIESKQYVSAAWIDVTAMSYQNGAWVAWVTDEYLYNAGNQCTDITGGWSINIPVTNTASSGAMFRTGDIYLGLDRSPGNNNSYTISAMTKKKIKLDNVDKIKFVIPTFSGSQNYVRCGVCASSVTSPAASVSINATGTFEVNTKDISGDFYAFVAIYTGWGASGVMDVRVYVSEVTKTGR